MRLHVGVEFLLQRGRGDHVRGHQRARRLPRHLHRLAARLRHALVVVLERRQFRGLHVHLDGRMILQEVDHVVVASKRARGVLRVDGYARIAGDPQRKRRARRDVGQCIGHGGAVGIVPRAGRARALCVRILDRERQRQLRVVLAHDLLAQVDLERSQPQQHQQRVVATSIDGVPQHRVMVDPRQEVLRQRDSLRLACFQRPRARRRDLLRDARLPGAGAGRGCRICRQRPRGREHRDGRKGCKQQDDSARDVSTHHGLSIVRRGVGSPPLPRGPVRRHT